MAAAAAAFAVRLPFTRLLPPPNNISELRTILLERQTALRTAAVLSGPPARMALPPANRHSLPIRHVCNRRRWPPRPCSSIRRRLPAAVITPAARRRNRDPCRRRLPLGLRRHGPRRVSRLVIAGRRVEITPELTGAERLRNGLRTEIITLPSRGGPAVEIRLELPVGEEIRRVEVGERRVAEERQGRRIREERRDHRLSAPVQDLKAVQRLFMMKWGKNGGWGENKNASAQRITANVVLRGGTTEPVLDLDLPAIFFSFGTSIFRLWSGYLVHSKFLHVISPALTLIYTIYTNKFV